MSAAVVVAALFPNPGPRPARRPASAGRLVQLGAVCVALLPLAIMTKVLAFGA